MARRSGRVSGLCAKARSRSTSEPELGGPHDAPPPLVAAVAAQTHLIVFQIWAVDGAWRALL